MQQKDIESILYNILYTWTILIQLDNNKTPNEIILVDQIYKLYDSICNLLHLDGKYILDTWEKNNYSIDNTIQYIISNNFEVVQ